MMAQLVSYVSDVPARVSDDQGNCSVPLDELNALVARNCFKNPRAVEILQHILTRYGIYGCKLVDTCDGSELRFVQSTLNPYVMAFVPKTASGLNLEAPKLNAGANDFIPTTVPVYGSESKFNPLAELDLKSTASPFVPISEQVKLTFTSQIPKHPNEGFYRMWFSRDMMDYVCPNGALSPAILKMFEECGYKVKHFSIIESPHVCITYTC